MGGSMKKTVLLIVFSCSLLQADLVEFKAGDSATIGKITNDGVMGGLSKGKLKRNERGSMTFSGTLSLENNGGFSLWRVAEGKWDLSDSKGVTLKVKGDGRTYKLRLATNERYRFGRVSFQADLPTKKGEWTEVMVPFSELKASWRGRDLKNQFDPAKVREIGIILADKNPGTFQVEVASISAD